MNGCLPVEKPSENERCHNGGVTLNDELGRGNVQFTPCNLFVGHRPRIRTVAGGAIGDLAEIAPKRNVGHFHILIQHRNHTDGEIACDTTTYLEETNTFSARIVNIPLGQPGHVFNARFHG